MSSLSDVTCNEINIKLMITLVANEGIKLSKGLLYSKLVDKFGTSSSYIDPKFKAKFELVFRNLEKKNDDVVFERDGSKVYVIYNKEAIKDYSSYEHPENKKYDLSSNIIDNSDLNKYIIV